MRHTPIDIRNVRSKINSVLFETTNNVVFYEKLTNSIHAGEAKDLLQLQESVEKISYSPTYEAESLRAHEGNEFEGLLLNVTESCDLACTYCIYSGNYKSERNENPSLMDFSTAKKAIDLFMPRSEERALIAFYGGEPLNNMSLVNKIVEYTRSAYPQKQAAFSMTTNFYQGDKHIEDVVRQGIFLNVSLDGPRDVHDRFRIRRDGGPTWSKVANNLELLDEFCPGYAVDHVGISVTCADPADLGKVVDFFLRNNKFPVVRIGGIEPKGLTHAYGKRASSLDISMIAQDFSDCIQLGRIPPSIYRAIFDHRLNTIANRSREKMPSRLPLSGSCYPGNRKLFVDTDGRLYMCEKFGRRLSIGHINGGLARETINNSIRRFREIRDFLCTRGCWAQRICSPCIQSAKDPRKDISVEGLSRTCESTLTGILMALALFVTMSQSQSEYFRNYLGTISIQ